ncbi:MAG: hypothetical protein Q4B48_06680 [Syntrophomonadaceae bacterium]|nr:hypothetical protein [Syntrophomonadaceae bacterium]
MECPNCGQEIGGARKCPYCSADLNDTSWTVIRQVNPPEDLIIESLLQSFAIPVRIIPRETLGSLYPTTIGPISRISIAVPSYLADKAVRLLEAEISPDDAQNQR